MANINKITTTLNTNLPDNGSQFITAEKLRNTLLDVVYETQECYDITSNNNTSYSDITTAANAVPVNIRKSGMSIRFKNSYTQQYEEWRYLLSDITATNFYNSDNWENIVPEGLEETMQVVNQIFGFAYTFDFINANWDGNSFDITGKTIGRQQQLKDCKILYLGSDNQGAVYPQEGVRNANGYRPARQTKLRIIDVYPGTNITLKTLNITGESILNNSANLKLISDTIENNIHTINFEVIDNTDTYINLQNANYTYYREIRIYANDSIFPFRTEINDGGGTVYVENYGTEDLYTSLLAAIEDNDDYTVFDCTYFTGTATFPNTVEITKPCTILFGNITITSSGLNFFEIKSGNVQIIGYGRQTDKTATDVKNSTVLIMNNNGITNESNKGYHIYSKGNKNLRFEYLTLKGIKSTLGRQCGNSSYPIDGCGGIMIEKANPTRTYFGNTCNNIVINQLLIDGTKTHGIYISTPILTTITNTRLSSIAGHSIFLNGGTSVALNNVYSASSELAGFCLLGVNYVTLNNCVSENCGLGFLVRGSFNVSIFSPGIETSEFKANNPWSNAYLITNKYGYNVETHGWGPDGDGNYTIPETQIISDVNSDIYNAFVGTPYMIVGGRGISMYTPYATDIAKGGSGLFNINNTALLRVVGNARKIYINNIQGAKLQGANQIYNDIKIEANSEGSPNGVEIIYDVTQPLITSPFVKYVTPYANTFAPIFCTSTARNVIIRNGATFYTPINCDDGIISKNGEFENLNTDTQKSGNIIIDGNTNNIKIVEQTVTPTTTSLNIVSGSIGQNTGQDVDNSNYIRTSGYVEWSPEMTYTATLADSAGYSTRLYVYYDDDGLVYSTYYDLGTLTASNFGNINNYLQEGQYFRLRFTTPTPSNVSLSVTKNTITEIDKIKFNSNGDAVFNNSGRQVNIINGNIYMPQNSVIYAYNIYGENIAYKTDITDIAPINITDFILTTGSTLNYSIANLVKHHLYCDRTGQGRWCTCQLETSGTRSYIYFDYNQSTQMYRRFVYITENNGVITHESNFRQELFTNTNLA